MKTSEFVERRVERFRVVLRALKLSLQTERDYCRWMRRFISFAMRQPDRQSVTPEAMARRFVEVEGPQWAVATQDQFRNALVSYYKHALGKPLGHLGAWAHARRPDKLPVWLPHDDMLALLSHLRGEMRLMAQVGYGSGLRSRELASLRWGNIDFAAKTITVRGGKGNKDRVTFLPEVCIPALQAHMEEMRVLYLRDRRDGRPGVEVPSVKYNGTDWSWFWIWAARNESADPRTGITRRHHIHRSALGKALRVAVRKWGGNQRVTQHSLRHSFATTLLERGTGIHVVQQLLGHAHIATTQVYAHVLPRQAIVASTSPMDLSPRNIVILPLAHEIHERSEVALRAV